MLIMMNTVHLPVLDDDSAEKRLAGSVSECVLCFFRYWERERKKKAVGTSPSSTVLAVSFLFLLCCRLKILTPFG